MIASSSRISQDTFGRTRDGRDVTRYSLASASGMSIEVLDFGAVVRRLCVPDRTGRPLDVVLGYDDLRGYEEDPFYIGTAVGRYANRIRNGKFVLEGTEYSLSINNGAHHLHGGRRGFSKAVWTSRSFEEGETVGIVLQHESPDGDEGYPGNLDVEITYSLTEFVFAIDYRGTTDRPTPVSLTHHAYFNLSGAGAGDVLDHELTIYADRFTEIDSDLLPTGRLAAVDETPFDFRQRRQIGSRIGENHDQLRIGRGYDHNFVIGEGRGTLSRAARVFQPASGVVMQVFSTEPGMQLYTGNFLDGSRAGKDGHCYGPREGFCLETQHFPDSPNHPEFPDTILRPGDELRSRTEYRFSTQ